MNLPTKFHRNRHCINGALDRTDRQTYIQTDRHADKHIDGKSDNKGRSKKKKIFFFDFIDYPIIDGKHIIL